MYKSLSGEVKIQRFINGIFISYMQFGQSCPTHVLMLSKEIQLLYMKKLLDSVWLRTMQFKCNIGEKSVTPLQFHIIILDYDWLKDNMKFSKSMILIM